MAGRQHGGAARYSLAGPARLLLDLESSARCRKAKLRVYVQSGRGRITVWRGIARLVVAAPAAPLRARASRLRDDRTSAARFHAGRIRLVLIASGRMVIVGHGQAQAVDPSRVSARGALSQLDDAPAALEQAWGMSGAQLERPPDLVALFCAARAQRGGARPGRGDLRPRAGRGHHRRLRGRRRDRRGARAAGRPGARAAGRDASARVPASRRSTRRSARATRGPSWSALPAAARGCARRRARRPSLDARSSSSSTGSAACPCWAASRASAVTAPLACSRTAAAPRRAPSASCSRACR